MITSVATFEVVLTHKSTDTGAQIAPSAELERTFHGYFDTRIGHKRERGSYERIAGEIGLPPGEILFLSDVAEELDAARDAGMRTMQLVRDNDVVRGDHPVAHDFTEVVVD